jgi:hypothetical protein
MVIWAAEWDVWNERDKTEEFSDALGGVILQLGVEVEKGITPFAHSLGWAIMKWIQQQLLLLKITIQSDMRWL